MEAKTNHIKDSITPEIAYQLFEEECEGDTGILNTMVWNHYGLTTELYPHHKYKDWTCVDEIICNIIEKSRQFGK